MTAPLNRRRFLSQTAAVAGAACLPEVAFAAAPTDRRLVVLLLRGGLDGLALAPPYGDEHYAAVRGALALPAPDPDGSGALDLDGFFGLHPAARACHDLWLDGQLALVHAAAWPTRTRTHLQAQMVMESGAVRPDSTQAGWLNRAVTAMGGKPDGAVALGRALPPVLRGKAPAAPYAPPVLPRQVAGFFEKLSLLYGDDPRLADVLSSGLERRRLAERILSEDDRRAGAGAFRPSSVAAAAELTARLLARPDGPRLAVIETAGWDTHTNQGVLDGPLARRLAGLGDCFEALRIGLDPVWDRTVVVAVSEFGRTAIPNGTGGTDHGTGGLILLAGGSVLGGRVHGRWPGLVPDALFQGRDLAATTDHRAVLKAVLAGHLGLDRRALDSAVFPDSAKIAPLEGLLL